MRIQRDTRVVRRTYAAVCLAALILAASCGGSLSARQDAAPLPPPTSNTSAAAPLGAPVDAREEGESRAGATGDRYDYIAENPFLAVGDAPLSTFSIDVDTASYSNVRRFLTQGQRPPKDAVRIEELLNYFRFDYPEPTGDAPFSVTTETASCPWNAQHRVVHVGLRGKSMEQRETPPRNLVFLLDTSGSMNEADKLPLVQSAMKMLVGGLTAQDRVSIVAYAGAAGLVLEPTEGDRKSDILKAIDNLSAGGSTAGGQGIMLAYKVAEQHFAPNGVNRVILCTDGDFNVGVTDTGSLTRLIEEKRRSGVFLTVLGVGRGNLNDAMMEQLADKGNGNYAYLDSVDEARKVLVQEAGATLVTIAKDVKIQVEFNPKEVAAYRLIGYEDRILRDRDFNDDTKDAGDVGAGHTVTALYEVVPRGQAINVPGVDELKYQEKPTLTPSAASGEMMTVKLRYKEPQGETSKLLSVVVRDSRESIRSASANLRFSAAVAAFGMLLRDSRYKGTATYGDVMDLASNAKGEDSDGYRAEFLTLVEKASGLSKG
jgi:Ca-activated chloride channel homolog